MRPLHAFTALAGLLVLGIALFLVVSPDVAVGPREERSIRSAHEEGATHEGGVDLIDRSDLAALVDALEALGKEQRETRAALRALRKTLSSDNADTRPPEGAGTSPLSTDAGVLPSRVFRDAEARYVAEKVTGMRARSLVSMAQNRLLLEKEGEPQAGDLVAESRVRIARKELESSGRFLNALDDVNFLEEFVRFCKEQSYPVSMLLR